MIISTNLKRDFALRRSAEINSVDYEIFLNLPGKSEFYEGEVELKICFASMPESLDLDCITCEIREVRVNGRLTQSFTYSDNRLSIPNQCFLPTPDGTEQRVRILYKNRFDKNGMGLHRYLESSKDQEFIFSDLEPAECQRIFPCFDQPDIKGCFTLKLETPASWTVASNGTLIESKTEGKRTLHYFKTSLKLSTYLFCLIAGNYALQENLGSKTPLRIFYRPSMEAFIPSQEIFNLTQKSLDHFESYLGIPYPYEKYDQAFVPEFAGGAMENAALVVFTEQYLPKHRLTTAEEFDFAGTIVHEMAHMWFGNLVTMKWWDDLWLNEAFATYFGYVFLEDVSRFKEARLYFCQEVKSRALEQDQLSTTHPIVSDCEDTLQAFANFDCITYEKAASVVQQLIYLLGEEKFRNGLREYLKHFSFAVSTWQDFLHFMQAESTLDLKRWSHDWLQTAGVNTVSVEPSYSEKQLKSLRIKQFASQKHPVLRTHKMRVALYQDHPKTPMLPFEILDLTYQGSVTEVEIISKTLAPDFILPNFDDLDYVKTEFDPDSLDFAGWNYPRFEEPLVRQIILNCLNSMVEDGNLSPLYFLKWVWNTLEQEPLENLAVSMLASFSQYFSSSLSGETEKALAPQVREVALESLGSKTIGYDLKDQWFYLLLRSTLEMKDSAIFEMAVENQNIAGLELDLEKQWSVARLLAALHHPQAEKDARILMDRDGSDRGEKRFFEIAISLSTDKISCFEELIQNKDRSTDSAKSGMRAFFHRLQESENRPILNSYFDRMLEVHKERDMVFSKDYSSSLFPFFFLRESLEHLDKLLASPLPITLERAMKENRDRLKKRQKRLTRFKTHSGSISISLKHQAALSEGRWQKTH
jgi:aminopeptidase N